MKKVCVIGHFGFGHTLLNGQTIKTKIMAAELEKTLPKNVVNIDTHGGVKSLLKAPFHCLKALRQCENVVILPAHKGVRIYAPLLVFLRRFFRARKLHYAVVGGWLPKLLDAHKGLRRSLRRFDCLYAETSTLKRALTERGFHNVEILPNCKELTIVDPATVTGEASEPYRLCTFSRVMRDPGIEDAVTAVKAVNETAGRTVYSLDIYGQVDRGQIEWFDELQKQFPDYVTYGGEVPFDRSVEALQPYFALLFPTRFYTEGIPGTIIDAYAAGVPVVSARWESFADMIDDGKTGIGYTFGNVEELTAVLTACAEHPQTVLDMKPTCLEKAEAYLPHQAIQVLLARMDVRVGE